MLILVSVLIIISGCSKPPKPAPVPVSPDDPGNETPRTFVNGEWDLVRDEMERINDRLSFIFSVMKL